MKRAGLILLSGILAVALSVGFSAPSAQAQGARLFGIIGGFHPSAVLVELDPSDGSLIDTIGQFGGGIQRFSGMVIHNGVVYTVGHDFNGTNEYFLYSIDLSNPRSGDTFEGKAVGSQIANLGTAPDSIDGLPDLFKKNGSKGLRLYATTDDPDGFDAGIVKIKKSGGLVKSAGVPTADDNGVCGAMNDKNRLFMIAGDSGDADAQLYKVKKGSGASVAKATVTFPNDGSSSSPFQRCAAMDFYPGNNQLIHLIVNSSWGGDNSANYLAWTSVRGSDAGVVTTIGQVPPFLEGIAYWR